MPDTPEKSTWLDFFAYDITHCSVKMQSVYTVPIGSIGSIYAHENTPYIRTPLDVILPLCPLQMLSDHWFGDDLVYLEEVAFGSRWTVKRKDATTRTLKRVGYVHGNLDESVRTLRLRVQDQLGAAPNMSAAYAPSTQSAKRKGRITSNVVRTAFAIFILCVYIWHG